VFTPPTIHKKARTIETDDDDDRKVEDSQSPLPSSPILVDPPAPPGKNAFAVMKAKQTEKIKKATEETAAKRPKILEDKKSKPDTKLSEKNDKPATTKGNPFANKAPVTPQKKALFT